MYVLSLFPKRGMRAFFFLEVDFYEAENQTMATFDRFRHMIFHQE